MFYLASTLAEGNASGQIKIRLTDKAGVTILAADQLLIIGPASGGGGGGGAVDATTVLQTGDIKVRYDNQTRTGFVRCNGNTIGATGSGANELADTTLAQALFEYLWAFPNITLQSASKGANAHQDFIDLKRMILPDLRGRVIAGMDDMGATAASRLTSAFFGSSGIVLGNVGGNEATTLSLANMPAHTHTGTASGTTDQTGTDHTHAQQGTFTTGGVSASHTHLYGSSGQGSATGGGGVIAPGVVNATSGESNDHTHQVTISGPTGGMSSNHTHSFASSPFTTSSQGSGTAHRTMAPALVMTIYIKL